MLLYEKSAKIPKIVDDILVVEVERFSVNNNLFDYVITDNNSNVVRKGNFTGPLVQMSTRFFEDGHYKMRITNAQLGVSENFEFKKKRFSGI